MQGKALSVVLNGKNVSVPLFGSAAPTPSPIVSTAYAPPQCTSLLAVCLLPPADLTWPAAWLHEEPDTAV